MESLIRECRPTYSEISSNICENGYYQKKKKNQGIESVHWDVEEKASLCIVNRDVIW